MRRPRCRSNRIDRHAYNRPIAAEETTYHGSEHGSMCPVGFALRNRRAVQADGEGRLRKQPDNLSTARGVRDLEQPNNIRYPLCRVCAAYTQQDLTLLPRMDGEAHQLRNNENCQQHADQPAEQGLWHPSHQGSLWTAAAST